MASNSHNIVIGQVFGPYQTLSNFNLELLDSESPAQNQNLRQGRWNYIIPYFASDGPDKSTKRYYLTTASKEHRLWRWDIRTGMLSVGTQFQGKSSYDSEQEFTTLILLLAIFRNETTGRFFTYKKTADGILKGGVVEGMRWATLKYSVDYSKSQAIRY